MKLNRTLGLLLVATATVGAGAAMAAATGASTNTQTTTAAAPATGGRHWHHHQGGMLVGVMLHATQQLNLTSDQQASIKDILATARAQRQSAAGSAGGRPDLMSLANPGDPNYATAVQSARSAASSRLEQQLQLQEQIYNVLTADQKAKLPTVLAGMKSKMEARRAAWQQQHAGSAAPAEAGSN